jgi:hypothetical protein
MAYNPQNPNGQAAGANSAPVVIASDQSAVPTSNTFQSNQTGTWGYDAGTSGTASIGSGKRVIGIAAHATTAGSFTINGGVSIPVPANSSVEIQPLGNVTNPTIVFSGTDSYFVEFLS